VFSKSCSMYHAVVQVSALSELCSPARHPPLPPLPTQEARQLDKQGIIHHVHCVQGHHSTSCGRTHCARLRQRPIPLSSADRGFVSKKASISRVRFPESNPCPAVTSPAQKPTAAQLLAVSYATSCTATARPEGSSLPAQAASHSAAVAVLHATDGPPAQQHTQRSTAQQSAEDVAQPPICPAHTTASAHAWPPLSSAAMYAHGCP
jgi:hypothetical protein